VALHQRAPRATQCRAMIEIHCPSMHRATATL
jgi:hypothetical protein